MSFTLVHEDRVTSIDFLSYHNSQAALKNSSRSPAFTPLFAGVLHPTQLAAYHRVAHRVTHRDLAYYLQAFTTLRV